MNRIDLLTGEQHDLRRQTLPYNYINQLQPNQATREIIQITIG